MKAKKAVKRLDRAASLLSGIIDKYAPAGDHRLQELLTAAKLSVVHAKETLNRHASTTVTKKPPSRANSAKPLHLTAEGRKRLSLAAKRRWAAAKRKGVHAVTGRPLHKTA